MTPGQISQKIQTALIGLTWTGGQKVFAYNSVKVTNNPEDQFFLALATPWALVVIGDFQSDPVHKEEPDYMIGTIYVRIGISAQDSSGQAGIVGANRQINTSQGAGLQDIIVMVKTAIDYLNKIDGVDVQFMATGNTQAKPVMNANFRFTQDLAFECIASTAVE